MMKFKLQGGKKPVSARAPLERSDHLGKIPRTKCEVLAKIFFREGIQTEHRRYMTRICALSERRQAVTSKRPCSAVNDHASTVTRIHHTRTHTHMHMHNMRALTHMRMNTHTHTHAQTHTHTHTNEQNARAHTHTHKRRREDCWNVTNKKGTGGN